MLEYEQKKITEKERESMDKIIHILIQHLETKERSQFSPSVNSTINVAVGALSRVLAPFTPPANIGKMGDAIGRAITLNIGELQKFLNKKIKEELNEMPS